VKFSEQPPSKQWAALKYRGETAAEIWFKPEGDPFAVMIRIPQRSFQIPDISQRLTADNLLRAVGITAEEVESWRHEGASDCAENGSPSELQQPLLPPAEEVSHLTLYVQLKPPAEAAAQESSEPEAPEAAGPTESGEQPEVAEEKWQELEARWKTILEMEASLDTLRISMEGLRGEMETASRTTLMGDEKIHAFNADIAQWTKAKTRVVYALPKMREFIHRSTWVTGAPERKQLGELYTSHIQPRIPFAEMEKVAEQLENLLKDRQVLAAHGNQIYQECKTIAADVQGTLRTLKSNATANATKKRLESKKKGKFF
jgi:hypothetical protein